MIHEVHLYLFEHLPTERRRNHVIIAAKDQYPSLFETNLHLEHDCTHLSTPEKFGP